MATESFVIESDLTQDEAFALVVDLTNVDRWDEGVRNPRHVGGTPGETGATYEVTVVGFDGSPTTVTYELTEVDAPHQFTMVGRHADFRADDTISFEATATGCRVSYDAGLVLMGDEPPLDESQLDALFASLVDVPKKGLAAFLVRS